MDEIPVSVSNAKLTIADIRPINDSTTDYVLRLNIFEEDFLVSMRIAGYKDEEYDFKVMFLEFVREKDFEREVQNIYGFKVRQLVKCFFDIIKYAEDNFGVKYLGFCMFRREASRIRAHRAIINRAIKHKYGMYAPAPIYKIVYNMYPESLENSIFFVVQRPEVQKEEEPTLEDLGIDLTKL